MHYTTYLIVRQTFFHNKEGNGDPHLSNLMEVRGRSKIQAADF